MGAALPDCPFCGKPCKVDNDDLGRSNWACADEDCKGYEIVCFTESTWCYLATTLNCLTNIRNAAEDVAHAHISDTNASMWIRQLRKEFFKADKRMKNEQARHKK